MTYIWINPVVREMYELESLAGKTIGGPVGTNLHELLAAYQAQQSGYHLVTDGEGLIDATIAVAVTEEFADTYPQLMTPSPPPRKSSPTLWKISRMRH